MARGLAEAIALFGLPFLLYAVVLALRHRYPFLAQHWPRGRLALLAVVGLGVLLFGALVFGLLAPRHQGAYVPAHIEGGRLVPGRIQ